MPSVSRWVCLSAALWAAVQCGAGQGAAQEDVQALVQEHTQQTIQSGSLADQGTDLSSTMDLLWTVLDRAVKSAVEPLITELNTRLDIVQTDLVSHLDRVQSELDAVKTQLNSQNTDVTVQLKRVQTQLENKMDNMKTELTAQITELNTGLNTVQTQLNSQDTELASCLDGVKAQLTTQNTDLVTRLKGVQTQLETKMDNMKTELVAQNTELTTRLDSVLTGLDGVKTDLDSVRSDLLNAVMPIRDCSDVPAGTASGVHTLQPGLNRSMLAYCDMETDGGGWTVIQRRGDIQPRRDFYLDWNTYKEGFGELEAEFWWGLENMWLTTSLKARSYELRVELEDFDNEKRYAVYQAFRVSSEADGYRMTVSKYTGNAGDGLTFHSGSQFSTKDKDQDGRPYSCALRYKGGWWYAACHHANLNGLYLSGQTTKFAEGVTWAKWRGQHYSLMRVEMKIRPTSTL